MKKDPYSSQKERLFFPSSSPPPNFGRLKWVIGAGLLSLLVLALLLILFKSSPQESSNLDGPSSANGDGNPLILDSSTSLSTSEDKRPLQNLLEIKIQRFRSMLERAETRRRVLVAVRGLLELNVKASYKALKLALLNKGNLHKFYQLDFTGRLDAKNRPELVPSHRRLFKLILDLLVKQGGPAVEDILYSFLDTRILDRPDNTYYYNLHLETLLAISRLPNPSPRAIAVYRRILRKTYHHRYSMAEKEWALVGLHNLKTQESYQSIMDFILQEDQKLSYAYLGIKTLIQSNDLPDIKALMKIAKRASSPKIRIRCYKALAGIPGPEDSYGLRITANREKLDKKTLAEILNFLKARLKVEIHQKAISILRMAISRLQLMGD